MSASRRLLAVLVALAGAFAVGGGSAAAAVTNGGPNHVVQVSSTLDGEFSERAGTQVAPAAGPAVSSSNIAVATNAGCTACHTSAAAVQVLFVTGNPSVFTPANFAGAFNGGCDSCGAFAYAWQYTIQTDGPVHLSPEGQQRVATLRQEISDAVAATAPVSLGAVLALNTQLDALTAELKSVVENELVQAGVHGAGAPERQVDASPSL